MPTKVPRALLEIRYYEAAQEYLRSLPPEHFMEAYDQGTQREITLESLALVKAFLPKVHVLNEMLLQYDRRGTKKPVQVVPDNTVIVYEGSLTVEGSYDVPLQPVGPFWVLEYVSKRSKRKDYEENLEKYEHDLKVPYYLTFYPDNEELTLRRHTGRKYVTVLPNENGRYGIPELELEVALLDGWVRFWFRGELLPLPADLLRQLEAARVQAEAARVQAEAAQHRAEEAEAEVARLRAELAALKRKPGN
jgi:Uma2 family endonuclease